MDKRERLAHTLAGEPVDRPAVAVWRHWIGDDQRGPDLAQAVMQFQQQFDWDVIPIVPANTFSLADYGSFDVWDGDLYGRRKVTQHPIQRSLDWTNLRPLDPERGDFGRMLESIQLVTAANTEKTPMILTVFSPFSQALELVGRDMLLHHLRTSPDRIHLALNVFAESLTRFLDVVRKTDIEGIHYVIDGANYDLLSPQEYQVFGQGYDRQILSMLPSKFWLNIVHLRGTRGMFQMANDLQASLIQWQDRDSETNLVAGKSMALGAVCGGITAELLQYGPATSIRDQSLDTQQKTNGRRILLSAGSFIHVTTPLAHLRALRQSVER